MARLNPSRRISLRSNAKAMAAIVPNTSESRLMARVLRMSSGVNRLVKNAMKCLKPTHGLRVNPV